MTEQDAHKFSSSPHRLPTLSASQTLTSACSTSHSPISTRLKRLDSLLQGWNDDDLRPKESTGGISKAEVTEIVGPPGVGKTSLAFQIAAHALKSGDSVVWIDTSYTLNGSRLKAFLSASGGNDTARIETEQALKGLHHFTVPTLAHLFALLDRPCESFLPRKTSLFVVDNISVLFSLAFPKSNEKSNIQQTPAKKNQVAQLASGRRWAVMDKLISDLGKLAVTENVAVVLISQMTTRIRDETRAVLYPALAGTAWESGIAARIVIFRDYLLESLETSSQGTSQPALRFAGVTKAKSASYEGMGRLVTFRIKTDGLEEESIDAVEMENRKSPALRPPSLKRRHREIADSESEDGDAASDHDFGWDDEATLEAGVLVG